MKANAPKPNCKQARGRLAQSKSNVGRKANIDEQGSVKRGSKEAEEKLQKMKARAKCNAGHKKGH